MKRIMEEKILRGTEKKKVSNGKTIKNVFSDFLGREDKHEFSIEMGERSLKRKGKEKRMKTKVGCNNDKSKFEYLLEAVSLFSAYEEERNLPDNRHGLRNSETVDSEEEGHLLPREFLEKIKELNGSEIKFVIEKTLFSTDLDPKHARLSIPPSKIANKFLSETEESSLDECIKENGRLVGLLVTVLDPSLKEYKMCLKKWYGEKLHLQLDKGMEPDCSSQSSSTVSYAAPLVFQNLFSVVFRNC
ncbi:hypothetical protein LR48_Vigan07g021300 [Vigna angularis]|uniref:Uncharacterized protein n=1 Tax=Phaseolus angularis TaxID=3914 RepID=A0A0L9UVF5_PHAAN|nr:hypothetical protein LR48_Vigan07g021300 [Vigna angularis]